MMSNMRKKITQLRNYLSQCIYDWPSFEGDAIYKMVLGDLNEALDTGRKPKSKRGWHMADRDSCIKEGDWRGREEPDAPLIGDWVGTLVSEFNDIEPNTVVIWRKDKPKSKWHRVEDELPDTNRLVITRLCRTDGVELIFDNRFVNLEWKYGQDQDVTHWRELPKFKPERDS
jgi:hypothetical protein